MTLNLEQASTAPRPSQELNRLDSATKQLGDDTDDCFTSNEASETRTQTLRKARLKCAVILIYLFAAVLLTLHFIIGKSDGPESSAILPQKLEEVEPESLLASVAANTEKPIVAKNNLAKTFSVQQFASADGQPITKVTIVENGI